MNRFEELLYTYAMINPGFGIIAHSFHDNNQPDAKYFRSWKSEYYKPNVDYSSCYYYTITEEKNKARITKPVFVKTRFTGQSNDKRNSENYLAHSISLKNGMDALNFYPIEIFLKDIWKKSFTIEEDNRNFRYDFSRSEKMKFTDSFKDLIGNIGLKTDHKSIIINASSIIIKNFNKRGFKLFIQGDYTQLFDIISSITILFPLHLARKITFRSFTGNPLDHIEYLTPHLIGVPDDVDFDFQKLRANNNNFFLIDSTKSEVTSSGNQKSAYIEKVVNLILKGDYDKVQYIFDKILKAGIDQIDTSLDSFITNLDFIENINDRKPEEIRSFIGSFSSNFFVEEAYAALNPQKLKDYLIYLLSSTGFKPQSWQEVLDVVQNYLQEDERESIIKRLLYLNYETLSNLTISDIKQLNTILIQRGFMLYEPPEERHFKDLLQMVFSSGKESGIIAFMQQFNELFAPWSQKYLNELVAYWVRKSGKPAISITDWEKLKIDFKIKLEDVFGQPGLDKTYLTRSFSNLETFYDFELNLSKLQSISETIYGDFELELLIDFADNYRGSEALLAGIESSKVIKDENKRGLQQYLKDNLKNELLRKHIVRYLAGIQNNNDVRIAEFLCDNPKVNTNLIKELIELRLNKNQIEDNRDFLLELTAEMRNWSKNLQGYAIQWNSIYFFFFLKIQEVFITDSTEFERKEFDVIQEFFENSVSHPELTEFPLFFIRKSTKVSHNELSVALRSDFQNNDLSIVFLHIWLKKNDEDYDPKHRFDLQFVKRFLHGFYNDTNRVKAVVKIIGKYYPYSGPAVLAILARDFAADNQGETDYLTKSIIGSFPFLKVNYPFKPNYYDEIKNIISGINKEKRFKFLGPAKPKLDKKVEKFFEEIFFPMYNFMENEEIFFRWVDLVNAYYPGFSLYYIIAYTMMRKGKKIDELVSILSKRFPETRYIRESFYKAVRSK